MEMTHDEAEKFDEYVGNCGGYCPLCDSDDLDYGALSAEDEVVLQLITCLDCGAEWTDVFVLSSSYLEKRGGKKGDSE